ncbi:MAG: hypothetical protein GX958_01960 [Desulfitobacterium sp.]|nr:hypothetical protein [Desulfitobacterium sp.]
MKANLFGQRQSVDYSAYNSSYSNPYSYWNSYQRNPYSDRYLSKDYYPSFYPNPHNPYQNYNSPNYSNNFLTPTRTRGMPLGGYPMVSTNLYAPVSPHPQGYFPSISYGIPLGSRREFLVPSEGLEKILIAILILVALDLIFVRSR